MSIKKSQAILKRKEREKRKEEKGKRKEEVKKSSKCHKTWFRFPKFIDNIALLSVIKCFENLDRLPAIYSHSEFNKKNNNTARLRR